MDRLHIIGYSAADLESAQALAQHVFDHGTPIRAGHNYYLRHRDTSGAELWLQVDLGQSFVGMNPHFDARSTLALRLLRAVQRHEGTMDGAFLAALPGGQEFSFDLPDAHLLPALRLPANAEVQIAAFAEGPLLHTPHAPTGIRPLGPSQDATAQVTARILATRLLHNGHSGKPFQWMRLGLAGGEIEALSTPQPDLPATGQVIQGQFWLSGRVRVEPQETVPPRFLERIFWGA